MDSVYNGLGSVVDDDFCATGKRSSNMSFDLNVEYGLLSEGETQRAKKLMISFKNSLCDANHACSQAK